MDQTSYRGRNGKLISPGDSEYTREHLWELIEQVGFGWLQIAEHELYDCSANYLYQKLKGYISAHELEERNHWLRFKWLSQFSMAIVAKAPELKRMVEEIKKAPYWVVDIKKKQKQSASRDNLERLHNKYVK